MAKAKAWDKRDVETNVAWEAFEAYRDMGPERSLASVGKLLGKSAALMERWSAKHEWVSRCLSFDNDQLRNERSLHSRKGIHAGRARARIRMDAYKTIRKLTPQIMEMIEAPLWEDVVDEKTGALIRRPAKWTKGTIAQLITAQVALSKVVLDEGLAEELDFDPVTASPEECRAWAERVKTKLSQSRGLE